jgi:lactate permease
LEVYKFVFAVSRLLTATFHHALEVLMEAYVSGLNWLVAFLPIAALLILMIGFRWGAAEAGPIGWGLATVAALTVYRAPLNLVALESVKGLWAAFLILYIVISAILIYEVTQEADAFEPFRRGIERFSPNRLIQILAFGWVFASFLQGITGFGVPIAVAAPLLVGIGVRPLYAVIIPLVGHAWNNTFGTLAVAWLTLKEVTGLSEADAAATALYAAGFVWIISITGGLLVCWLYGRLAGVREGLLAVIPISLVQGGLTILLSQWNDTINGFIASIVAFALIFVIGKLPQYQRPSRIRTSPIFTDVPRGQAALGEPDPEMGVHQAFTPYYSLLGLTFGILLIDPVKSTLEFLRFGLAFPETQTGLGFTNASTETSVAIFTHAGSFLLLAALVGYWVFASMGAFRPGSVRRIATRTLDKSVPSIIAVSALVTMSFVLRGTGQAEVLAFGVAEFAGPAYPFLSPYIGVLGAFMTSSNLASNALFGSFQQVTAQVANLNEFSILGAQTAGGAAGNMIAPGNVLLGTTTAGILGREGDILKVTLPLALLIAAVIGTVALIVA